MAGRQWVKEMLRDFVFSFSQGAAAAAKTPGARGGAASLAASLQAPQLRQDMIRQRTIEDEERQQKMEQLRRAATLGDQQQIKNMIDIFANTEGPQMSVPRPTTQQAPLPQMGAGNVLEPQANVPAPQNMGMRNIATGSPAPMQIGGQTVQPLYGNQIRDRAMQEKLRIDEATTQNNIAQNLATQTPKADPISAKMQEYRDYLATLPAGTQPVSFQEWAQPKPQTQANEPNQQSREVVRNGRTILEYFKGADPSKVTFTVDMGPVKDKTDDPLTSYQKNQTFLNISNRYQGDAIVNVAIKGQTAKAIADQVIANPASAANQMKSLYVFVKNLDADSAVREGETALAQQTQSYFEKFKTSLNRVSEGAILSPSAAKELAIATKELVTAWESTAKTRTGQYKSQATTAGVGPQFDQYISGFGGIAGSGSTQTPKTIKFGDLPK